MSFASSYQRGSSSSANTTSSSSSSNNHTSADLFRELDKLRTLQSDSEKLELLNRVLEKFSGAQFLFDSNASDNKKNIFHYMALVNNVADLKGVFIKFAQLTRKFRPNPLFHRLAVGYTAVEYAVLKENKAYAQLVMDEILRNKELSFQDVQNHILIGLYNETLLTAEDTKAIIKQLHNAVIEYLLEQFERFNEQEKQYVVEYVVSVVNNDLLHYPSKHEKIPPLIHNVIGLANNNASHLEAILTKVAPEKLKKLDEYTDKHGDYALFYALRNIHNKASFPIFHVLLDKFDLEKTNARHGCNIFHKVFRNKFASSVPAILEILLRKFQSTPTLQELMQHLLLQQDKAGNSPLSDAVKFRIFNREHDSHILEAVMMIIDLFPDIGYPLHVTDQQRTLLDIVLSSTERCRDVLGQYIVRRCREENKKGAIDILRRNGMSYKESSSESSRHRERERERDREYSSGSNGSPLMKRHRDGYASSSSSRYAESQDELPFKRQRLEYSQQHPAQQQQYQPQHPPPPQHYAVMDAQQQQQQQQQHAYMQMYAPTQVTVADPYQTAAAQYMPQSAAPVAYAPQYPTMQAPPSHYVPQYSFGDSHQQPLVPAQTQPVAPTESTAAQVDSVKNFLTQIVAKVGDDNIQDKYKKLEEDFSRYRDQMEAMMAALRNRVKELEGDKANLQLQLSQYVATAAPPSAQQHAGAPLSNNNQMHDVQKILRMLSENATTTQ